MFAQVAEFFIPLFQVILIDLVLAADNAVVIGLAASGLSKHERRRAVQIGLIGAFVMRVSFSLVTVQLLQIVGLLFAGGLLLLWVAWKMLREIAPRARIQQKTFNSAIVQIIFADLSMSLDNILAVAGAAREHMIVLIIGLSLSILLMGTAASYLAAIIEHNKWIAYIGLIVVLWVAFEMLFSGAREILA